MSIPKLKSMLLPENTDAKAVSERIGELQGYIEMQQVYKAGIREITTKLEILDEEFNVRYSHNPIHRIESRLKSLPSTIEKLKRRQLPVTIRSVRENLTDMAGVRVVCNYIEDIYEIARMLTNQSDIKLLRMSDYIREPKPNGYRSLHLVMDVPVFMSDRTEHVPVEIQIRTIAMDFWASLEHQLRYKSDSDVSDKLREQLRDCAEKSAELDLEMQSIYKKVKRANSRQHK